MLQLTNNALILSLWGVPLQQAPEHGRKVAVHDVTIEQEWASVIESNKITVNALPRSQAHLPGMIGGSKPYK